MIKAGIRDAKSILPTPFLAQNLGLWQDILIAMAEVENGTSLVDPESCIVGTNKVSSI
jgi:hypothetical protein